MAETVGSLVDKISIVSLKVHHMALQVERTDATDEHRRLCTQRLAILKTQRDDLVAELTQLADDVINRRRSMKVYRQFKMYNDPAYRPKSNS